MRDAHISAEAIEKIPVGGWAPPAMANALERIAFADKLPEVAVPLWTPQDFAGPAFGAPAPPAAPEIKEARFKRHPRAVAWQRIA